VELHVGVFFLRGNRTGGDIVPIRIVDIGPAEFTRAKRSSFPKHQFKHEREKYLTSNAEG
jgi:hypothetical protein